MMIIPDYPAADYLMCGLTVAGHDKIKYTEHRNESKILEWLNLSFVYFP